MPDYYNPDDPGGDVYQQAQDARNETEADDTKTQALQNRFDNKILSTYFIAAGALLAGVFLYRRLA